MLIITTYEGPDVDGTACAYAYREFLRNQGKDVELAIFGIPHREAQFVINKFDIKLDNKTNLLERSDGIILVDASDTKGIFKKINVDKVVEIINHRKINESHVFKNAKVQIELVGAAATLVAEKFMENNVKPTKESAILLYSAIISNTLNFKANVTNQRDKDVFKWLKDFVNVPEDYSKEMFTYKSDFGDKSIKEVINEDLSYFPEIGGKRLGVAQLEVVELDEILKERLSEIKSTLKKIKEKKDLDYVFLTAIDLDDGFNKFLVIDDETKVFLEKSMSLKFVGNIAKRNGVIMRKEIMPIIKKYLERS